MNKKYIGYIRVSNKEHDTSLPAQKQKLISYAEEKGLILTKIYTEERSAFKANKRKQFNAMIKHLEQDDTAGVIFHKVDRSSRNMKDFSTLESFFDVKDILVIEGEFDTTRAQGRFMFRMFCSMAIWYSENLSEEVRLKMKERLKAGYCPKRDPFGYRSGTKSDPDIKKKYPNEYARCVKEIFKLYNTGNYSYRSLAEHIRNKGITMRKDLIETILSNPFYYGVIKWKHRKENEVCYYKGNHEPIISQELFTKVEQRRLERARNRGYSFSKNPYAKFLICECDSPLYWERPRNGSNKRNYAYFRCQNKSCSFTSIREDEFEKHLTAQLSSYIGRLKWLSKFKKSDKKYSFTGEIKESNLNKLNFELNQVKARIEKLEEGFLSGVFSAKEVKGKKAKLMKRKQNLIIEIEENKQAEIPKNPITSKRISTLFKTLANQYMQSDFQLKKIILDLCFSNGKIVDKKPVFNPTFAVCKLASFPKMEFGWEQETSQADYLRDVLSEFQKESVVQKIEVLEEMLLK